MPKKIFFTFFALFIFFSTYSFAIVNTDNLQIESEACILVEPSTDTIIYEKNSKQKMYPASTTKIMTALLAIENCNLNDIATVSNNAIKSISADYATVYLNEGEQLTIEQLLNILLIPSGNIVGNILSEHISGSTNAFTNLMNNRARELGCINTNFTNSYGLHDNNHYTCAYDLYLITKEAMKHDIFRSIIKQTSYKLAPSNVYKKDDRTFYTTNDLIKPNNSKNADNYYYPYAIGVKTGYTSQAKDCLVAASSKDNLEFISVILGAGKTFNGLNARYTETKSLFDFAYNNYYIRTIREENSIFDNIEIKNATKNTKNLEVTVQNKIVALVDKDSLYSTLPFDVTFKNDLMAPIFKGDIIGSITYNINRKSLH